MVALVWMMMSSAAGLVPGQKERDGCAVEKSLVPLVHSVVSDGLGRTHNSARGTWLSMGWLRTSGATSKEGDGVGQAAEIVHVGSALAGVVFYSLALSTVLELDTGSGQMRPTDGKHRSLPLTPHSSKCSPRYIPLHWRLYQQHPRVVSAGGR